MGIEVQREDRPSPQTVYVDIGHCTSRVKNPFTGQDEVDGGFAGLNTNEYSECSINTGVGVNLINLLRAEGIRVVPTWDPENPPALVSKPEDLQRRVDVVNNDRALHLDHDAIYVSIHHDNDETRESGQTTYFAATKAAEGLPLATAMQLSAWSIRPVKDNPLSVRPDTLTGNGRLVGLRSVNVPGVLIEGANVRNAGDWALMPTPGFQQMEAEHIARGVLNYYRLKRGSERASLVFD
jgi:N-acetylmuramoyl-L-alanine amidase